MNEKEREIREAINQMYGLEDTSEQEAILENIAEEIAKLREDEEGME